MNDTLTAQFEFTRREDRSRFIGEFKANVRAVGPGVLSVADIEPPAAATLSYYSVVVEYEREDEDKVMGIAVSCAGTEVV